MENGLFRKKSIEQLSSPEELNGYLRVTGPGIWAALAGIILVLAGFFVWGLMGTVISTVTVPAVADHGRLCCYVLKNDALFKDTDIEIAIGDVEMSASAEDAEEATMNASDDPALFQSGYLASGKNVLILSCETPLADGYYDAVVTTETFRPISLLFSQN